MLLTRHDTQLCFGHFPPTFKYRNKDRFFIFILKVWTIEYILLRNCLGLVSGFYVECAYTNRSRPNEYDVRRVFDVICMARLHDNCDNYQYATQYIQAQSKHMRTYSVVSFMSAYNAENAALIVAEKYKDNNATQLCDKQQQQSTTTSSVRKVDNMRQYKHILDLIELFLCLLVAICVEMLPLLWQQFQRQQQTFLALQTRRESIRNSDERNFWLKLWLKRRSMPLKTSKTNALLAIKLPLQQEQQQHGSCTPVSLQQDSVFTLIVVRVNERAARIRSKTIDVDVDATYVIHPSAALRKLKPPKEKLSGKFYGAAKTQQTQNCCYTCFSCCCCCSCSCYCFCAQCNCCCMWPCSKCVYDCCFCCYERCTVNSSYNNCCCCYYSCYTSYCCCTPKKSTPAQKKPLDIFKSHCQHAYACLLAYISAICCKKKPLFYVQQRRLHHTTPHLYNGHPTTDNCTSNYHQLKANNVCKFFCNNRRRRRKRRRRHAVTVQDCQSSNRLNLAIVNNQPLRIRIRCLSTLLSALCTSLLNVLRTFNKFQQHLSNDKLKEMKSAAVTTPRQFACEPHMLLKIVRNPLPTQQQYNFKRIYCRGLRSRPNLVWLLIGLVWFESSRLVDCYLQRQKLNENAAMPLLLPAAQFHMIAKNKDNVLKKCIPAAQYEADAEAEAEAEYNTKARLATTTRRYQHYYGRKPSNHKNQAEYSMPNDEVRLESIKRQILSKLGLAGRPNVSHPLPKEFIWDTIYRVDEQGTLLKNFDFAETITQGGATSTWSLMDNYGREHTVQVRFQSNTTHAPTQQSYNRNNNNNNNNNYNNNNNNNNKYSAQKFNSILQQTKYNSLNQRNRKNNQNNNKNKNKLTYLSGITSGMEVPINLESVSSYTRGSPRYETETIGFNSNRNPFAASLSTEDIYRSHNSAKQKEVMKEAEVEEDTEEEEGYMNDSESDEYYGKTEEIIAFAEEGQLYSQHRLVEFSTKSKELVQGKLFVRKAEIHLRIEHKSGKQRKNSEGNRKLKIWIFRVVETNATNKASEQKIQFCAAFDIDTHFLGWKKLDITETVQHWLMTRRMDRVMTEKLRLLIDCTGCANQYRLQLFEATKQTAANSKVLKNVPSETGLQQSSRIFQNDIVALWLRQQAVSRNGSLDTEELRNREQTQNLYRPFLAIRAEVQRARRVRRRVVDCSGALRGQCCKESFYVSFKALGWDDWIIAPRGYFANYCRGECTGPFRTPDTFQTFHAHFIEEYRKMGLLNGMKPCCAPIKFSSMSLIYYGDDGIIKRDLPKMVVDECGCP